MEVQQLDGINKEREGAEAWTPVGEVKGKMSLAQLGLVGWPDVWLTNMTIHGDGGCAAVWIEVGGSMVDLNLSRGGDVGEVSGGNVVQGRRALGDAEMCVFALNDDRFAIEVSMGGQDRGVLVEMELKRMKAERYEGKAVMEVADEMRLRVVV